MTNSIQMQKTPINPQANLMDRAGNEELFPCITKYTNEIVGEFLQDVGSHENASADLYDDETGELTTDRSSLDSALLEQDLFGLGDDDFQDYMYYDSWMSNNGIRIDDYYYNSNPNEDSGYETRISHSSTENNVSICNLSICVQDENDKSIRDVNVYENPSSTYSILVNYDNEDQLLERKGEGYHQVMTDEGNKVYPEGRENCNSIKITRDGKVRYYTINYDSDDKITAKSVNLVNQSLVQ